MASDVIAIHQPFSQHHVEHAVEQRDVATGQDGQVQIGDLGGFAAARIDDDDLQRRIGSAGILDVAENDRVGQRRIGAGDQDHPGLADILVTARRRIGPQGLLVAGDGRRHAQPRIGIDVIGADQPLGQLVEDIVVLGHQLAGDVESH